MEMQSAAGFFFAFIAVLALIGLATWLVRRFAGNRLGTGANRGRMPRLAVVDAAAVDGRRRLVLVRRDNIEHLLMIGGPSDIVVEPNIVRATPPQQQMPPRAPLPPAHEQAWADSEPMRPEPLDEPMPLPEPPPRPARPAFADEMRRVAAPEEMRRAPAPDEMRRAPAPDEVRRAPPVERRPDPLAGFSAEPMVRQEPPMREAAPPPRPAPRAPEPPPMAARPPRPEPPKPAPSVRPAERPTPPEVPSPTAAADKNLAEMAQRLEAALRRPGAPPAATDRAPPVAPEGGPFGRAAPTRPASEPAPAAPAESDNAPADAPKTQFKNLEDEMASLLGRPKTPS
jgi:flagellar protein FliO/FliZ